MKGPNVLIIKTLANSTSIAVHVSTEKGCRDLEIEVTARRLLTSSLPTLVPASSLGSRFSWPDSSNDLLSRIQKPSDWPCHTAWAPQ